jgi:hypothetical protein
MKRKMVWVALGIVVCVSFAVGFYYTVTDIDLIAGPNSVVWADKAIGSTVCGDGQTRPVRFGFRDDGSVVWRIEDNRGCFYATNKAMERKDGGQ